MSIFVKFWDLNKALKTKTKHVVNDFPGTNALSVQTMWHTCEGCTKMYKRFEFAYSLFQSKVLQNLRFLQQNRATCLWAIQFLKKYFTRFEFAYSPFQSKVSHNLKHIPCFPA